jgi:ATP-dependent helicase/nuclease subunit B
MSLRLIYGRAGSGKTRFCLEEIKNRINQNSGNQLVFLVPEQFSFQAERDLISILEAGGIIKTEVLSFRRMAFRIFNQLGGITYPHIHPAGKCMLIYRILDRMGDRFKVFSKAYEREGFVNTVTTLITEFKRYNVTPEHLKEASEQLGTDHPLTEKLFELHLIYEEFEKALSLRYRDSDDDLTLAARKLEASSLYSGSEIWIDGFASFTSQEYLLIESLLKKARRVNISLCTDSIEVGKNDDELDVFRKVKHACRKLYKMAKDNNIAIEEAVNLNHEPLPRFRSSPELAHLEKNLNAWPYQVYGQKTRDIFIFSSANLFSEVEAAARDILRLCRDEGMRYRDIAVITRDLEGYSDIVEVVFKEYEIPYFIDRKVDISNHPLVRLVLAMMDIFIDNWSYEAVFRYLKTGLTGIPQNMIDTLENYVLACGIRGSRWTSDEDWRMSPGMVQDEKSLEAYSEHLKTINYIRKKVIVPLMEFRKKTLGRNKASDFCAALYDFLCGLDVPKAIETSIEDFKKKGDLYRADQYSQVWNILMEVFDQIVEVMGDETFGLERFSKILRIGLGEYRIGLVPPSLDQVIVGSAERFRSHEIKAMILLGANDGVFPSTAISEGVLSDQDRAALTNIGLELASDTRTQAFDEQFLVYRALTTAEKYMRISWAIGDQEGRTLRPSTLVSRLKKLFPAISQGSDIIPSDSLEEEMSLITGKNPTFRHMVSALRKQMDGERVQPLWKRVYGWYASRGEWKQRCESALESMSYRNMAQQVSHENVRSLYGYPAVYSVSRLEKYTSCPFSFYVQYGLGAKERKVYRLSPPDIGTFMHAVIERFSRLIERQHLSWREISREQCQDMVSKIVDDMLSRMKGSGMAASKRYIILAARLKRVVERAVWVIAEHIRLGDFNPVDYEVGFGEGEKYPSIVLELKSGEKIYLQGRIDRVDELETPEGKYLRIIDYKSGFKDFRLSDVYYGLQIQLITYLNALWESGERYEGDDTGSKPCHPAGMLYFKIDDPIIRSNSRISEEEIEKSIQKQLKMRGLLLADVRLIKKMDNNINGTSTIIPATINKGDVLGKNTSGATKEQFVQLKKHVKKLMAAICEEIMKGNVSISPYKKNKSTPCTYCGFKSICQFDAAMKDNRYRILQDRSDDEIWSLMGQE